jgi:glutamyl-tRNA synthetase
MAGSPRVRFAPSPTGYLHVGGARTALFNWLFARKAGGAFVLRIEDTDRERSSDEMTRAILDGLGWLGLDWDEGPVHQADGVAHHREAVRRLVERGAAYRCFCGPEELQARRAAAAGDVSDAAYRYDRRCAAIPAADAAERAAGDAPHTVRFRVPEGATEWDDAVHGPMRFRNQDIEDFVVLRTDGTPTYNLAVVSDDVDMRISHVIRGDDHLSNTPKQILLYRALEAPVPVFAHLPMILGPDGKRLSKRHGATAVGEYREQGVLPEALVNFLALLGWNPGDEQEVMTVPELVARFGLERINKKSAVFDTEKLWWMNGQHISLRPASELLPLVAPLLIQAGLTSEPEIADRRDWFHDLVDLLKPRARVLDGIVEQARQYLAPELDYEEEAVAKHWKDPAEVAERLLAVQAALDALPAWDPPAVEAALRETAERTGVGFGKIVHPLRVALTGTAVSPGIDQVIAQMGRGLVRQRIEQALERIGVQRAEGNS